MSVIQSTTTTLSSPYATVSATSRTGGAERAAGLTGATGNAAMAATSGPDATTSFSDRALAAFESAGESVAHTVETGARDVGHAAMAAYEAVKSGISRTAHGVGELVGEVEDGLQHGWSAIKADAGKAERLAEGGLQAIGNGLADLEAVAEKAGSAAWNATTSVGDAAGSVLDTAGSVAGHALSYATLGVASIHG